MEKEADFMLHEFTFPSYNQRDQVQAWIYSARR